jgi:energy-converting hydrogenase Eha subunit F
MATAQLAEPQIAPRVVVVLAAMVDIADIAPIQLRRTQPHPTPHRQAAEVVAEGQVGP